MGIGVEGAKIEAAAPSPSVGLGLNSSATNATVESVPGFVKTQGQQFSLNGRAAYFAGTNAWCDHYFKLAHTHRRIVCEALACIYNPTDLLDCDPR